MEPDRMLLSAIAALQVLGVAERWFRSRETRETELEARASGPKSLATRIDDVQAAQAAQGDVVGRLQDIVTEINDAASARHSDLQVRIGNMDVEQRMKFATIDRDVKDMREALSRVEKGQTEWMRVLRHRSHALANHINRVIVRMAMTERGVPADKLPELKPVEIDSSLLPDEHGGEPS